MFVGLGNLIVCLFLFFAGFANYAYHGAGTLLPFTHIPTLVSWIILRDVPANALPIPPSHIAYRQLVRYCASFLAIQCLYCLARLPDDAVNFKNVPMPTLHVVLWSWMMGLSVLLARGLLTFRPFHRIAGLMLLCGCFWAEGTGRLAEVGPWTALPALSIPALAWIITRTLRSFATQTRLKPTPRATFRIGRLPADGRPGFRPSALSLNTQLFLNRKGLLGQVVILLLGTWLIRWIERQGPTTDTLSNVFAPYLVLTAACLHWPMGARHLFSGSGYLYGALPTNRRQVLIALYLVFLGSIAAAPLFWALTLATPHLLPWLAACLAVALQVTCLLFLTMESPRYFSLILWVPVIGVFMVSFIGLFLHITSEAMLHAFCGISATLIILLIFRHLRAPDRLVAHAPRGLHGHVPAN